MSPVPFYKRSLLVRYVLLETAPGIMPYWNLFLEIAFFPVGNIPKNEQRIV